ncbi:DUF2393 family protein [Campylobacter mucosalis]|uniref:Putative DUF2393 domain protein n=1 Tax=Campylobacter mucosalis CCUG 21559 TaxID=1032067 RepID=A0A6G5QEF8_9BACT|nr:DUF2393 family protein [Campylobacter mucosalis]KEA45780.1 hypothetical protein CR66_05030 [Campylobacter mucosalis]QCD43947.1 putative DUF2393 domain protein [Campylobacter mucosalis CCUG 21559]QKF62297.1 DUF2393 domain-containing protein [Campylobacter mucosalis]
MSASYFSIVHIIVIVVIAVLSLFLFVLSFRADRKIFLSLLFTNVLVSTTLCIFLMIVMDKYTKKGKLENITSHRVLMNESIVFNGSVRNVGRFMISNCKLTVKLVNQPLNSKNLNSEALFKPSGAKFFSWLFNDNSDDKPNSVEYKFSVAKDLEPKKSVPFSVSMPYPPYFSKTMHITKINCY